MIRIPLRASGRALLATIDLIELNDDVLDAAGILMPGNRLRSLDAIHVASALIVPGLQALLTYDDRMADAARAAGVTVRSPS